MFSRETELIVYTQMYIEEIYYEGLAHMTVEAVKSKTCPLQARQAGELVVWAQANPEGLGISGANGVRP